MSDYPSVDERRFTYEHDYSADTRPRIEHDDAERINDLFLGRTVAKVGWDELRLDDGRRLRIVPNVGCGGCSAGWYALQDLAGCDHVITRAEVAVTLVNPDDKWDESRAYRLFVFADNRKINLATVEGDDGNGYYGTGFWIEVIADD